MVAFACFVSSLLLVLPTLATPVPPQALKFPPVDTRGLLCKIPVIKNILCPLTGSSALNVPTPLGTARGTLDASGANRFSVRYASASRWAPSTVATTWNLPNGATNVTTLPLACPQPNADASSVTEDCLSMILYVPKTLTSISGAPTFMWIHGGSYIVGSATGPGLDGSSLAIATNSIVAVVQYRLGALGFLSPDGTTNLAVKDIVNALQFLKKIVPSFGGSASKITIAGQSSGADMVRAILAVPSASSLFQSAILQSDPMDYGFLSPTVQQQIQSNFNSLISCGATDTACRAGLSLDTIINAQMNVFSNAVTFAPSAGQAQPIRPVRDGSLITSPLDATGSFPSVNKPVLISSVLNEAGPSIYGFFTDPLPEEGFEPTLEATFGTARTDTILASPYYPPASSDVRPQLEKMGTDYIWKCSGWTLARLWSQHGGNAYVGLYSVGATYPGNDLIPFCTQPGSVCHQDDIEIVFGTVPSPTSAQSALTTEMQKRYKAFLSTGNPNAAGLPSWTAATSTNVHAKLLGGSGEAPVGACDPSFWGQAVQYDYQVFNI